MNTPPIISTRSFPAKTAEVWLANETAQAIKISKSMGVDVLYLRDTEVPPKSNAEKFAFLNGELALTKSLEDLFSGLDSSFRNEVRRAQKEGVKIELTTPASANIISSEIEDYINFSISKNLIPIPKKKLIAYASNGILIIGTAFYEGNPIRSHFYISSNNRILLVASFPRASSLNMKQNLLGWANRYLHWESIVFSKKVGLKYYSLGGIGNPGSNNNKNIVTFKSEMNPGNSTSYNYAIPLTTLGKVILYLAEFANTYRGKLC